MYLKVTSERLYSRGKATKYCPKEDNDCFEPDSLFGMTVNVTEEKNVSSMRKYEKLH